LKTDAAYEGITVYINYEGLYKSCNNTIGVDYNSFFYKNTYFIKISIEANICELLRIFLERKTKAEILERI